MTQPQPTTITAAFEITGWDETPYDEPADGPKLSRATVGKRFTGPLVGTSTAVLLMAQSDQGRGYVASERVEGTLDGRVGTFVIQHGGLDDLTEQRSFGSIVPGCGTGELANLRGEAVFQHDESGARLTLTLSG